MSAASSTSSILRWRRRADHAGAPRGGAPGADGAGLRGIPALAGGDTATFDALVRHNLTRFATEPFDYLVTACATCTSTIKKLWPLMTQDFPAADQARIAALADKTLDISQFLVDKLGLAPTGDTGVSPVQAKAENRLELAEPLRLTYHDPCHLKNPWGGGPAPGSAPGQPRLWPARNG